MTEGEPVPLPDEPGKDDAIAAADLRQITGRQSLEIASLPVPEESSGIYTDDNGEQWASAVKIGAILGVGPSYIYNREDGIGVINGRVKGRPSKLYNIDDAKKIKQIADQLPRAEENAGQQNIFTDTNGEQWADITTIASMAGIDAKAARARLDSNDVRSQNGQRTWRQPWVLYNLNEARRVLDNYRSSPQTSKTGIYVDDSGSQWATQRALQELLGKSHSFLNDKTSNILSMPGRDAGGHETTLYNIENARSVLKDQLSLPTVDKATGIYTDDNGDEWAVIQTLADVTGISRKSVEERLGAVRSIAGLNKASQEATLYNKGDLQAALFENPAPQKKVVEQPALSREQLATAVDEETLVLDKGSHVYTDANGQRWVRFSRAKEILGIDSKALRARGQNVHTLIVRNGRGNYRVLYNLDDALAATEHFINLPRVEKSSGIYTDDNGEQWATALRVSEILRVSGDTIKKRLAGVRSKTGRDPIGQEATLYNLAELREELKSFTDLPRADKTGIYTDDNGEQWGTVRALANLLQVSKGSVEYRLNNVRSQAGRGGAGVETTLYNLNDVRAVFAEQPIRNDVKLEAELRQVLSQETSVAELRKIISIFGSSHAVDVLYRLYPQFRGVPPEKVDGYLADYLGDYLLTIPPLNLAAAGDIIPHLSDANLHAGLIEVTKLDALAKFNATRQFGALSGYATMTAVFDSYRDQIATYHDDSLDSVVKEVEEYYREVFEDIHKPAHMADTLNGGGRAFPDINQLINIKEISDKQRMLIADEMGLGKSASAIMAKEVLGVEQAVVVVPSNLIAIWQEYLSDKVDADGKQVGYFKGGQAPRVLTVDSLDRLATADKGAYDYVLISHERLDSAYMQHLNQMDIGMLIVDEAHKLKNIREGVRATNLLELAKQVEGEGKYLALLSGTPVPNKVEDVAMVLKLLYPERFADVENSQLVRSIINGDLVDIRNLLVPRMQMKRLAESLPMPSLREEDIEIELEGLERDIYEVLMEEDELTASAKMQVLRQFLLNPALVDATPTYEGSKIQRLQSELVTSFETLDKVVVFVNGYIANVIRGDRSIIQSLDLPEGVEIRVIEANVTSEQRQAIQQELKGSGKKILLFVSGQTADVGVDFSGADGLYYYNEPWSNYDKRQQSGRVYRPGVKHDIDSKTLIVKGSIEEGIHQYIAAKERAIEKLLRGIPITELEKELLRENETQIDPNLEVNPELADYYFSSWDKMMKIFGYVKEIGEEDFVDFLEKYGREYADCYVDLGSRSYQANASRVAGAVVNATVAERGQSPQSVRILDIASGPEMLKKHIADGYEGNVYSIDINKYHFTEGAQTAAVGSFLNIPVRDKTFDYANLSLAWHYTSFAPSKDDYERVQVLSEVNRVLQKDGRAVVNLIYTLDLKDREKFNRLAWALGFRIVDEYSGEATNNTKYKSTLLTLEKVEDVDLPPAEIAELIGKENYDGLRFAKTKTSLKDSRKVITEFSIGEHNIEIPLNKADKDVLAEENEVITLGNALKTRHGEIANIPPAEIIQNGFVRILIKDKYILFKKLSRATGVVVVK